LIVPLYLLCLAMPLTRNATHFFHCLFRSSFLCSSLPPNFSHSQIELGPVTGREFCISMSEDSIGLGLNQNYIYFILWVSWFHIRNLTITNRSLIMFYRRTHAPIGHIMQAQNPSRTNVLCPTPSTRIFIYTTSW
jgi:hypothetical protein